MEDDDVAQLVQKIADDVKNLCVRMLAKVFKIDVTK